MKNKPTENARCLCLRSDNCDMQKKQVNRMFDYIKVTMLLLAIIIIAMTTVSCAGRGEPFTQVSGKEGMVFNLFGSSEKITGIAVEKDGASVCEFDTEGKSFELVDLNFDGCEDIRIQSLKNEGYYNCFLYHPSVGTFSVNTQLGELNNPVWNSESCEIISNIHTVLTHTNNDISGFKETRGEAVWVWNGGMLTQISETGYEYDSDTDMYHSYRSVLTDGVMTVDYSAEKWYTSEQFVAAGIKW